MPDVYENVTQGHTVKKSQAGWTAMQTWIFDGCDSSDPYSTLTQILQSDFIPARGDGHPSGEDMQADEITGEALSSTQVKVTVTYKKLSAVDAEPDSQIPALMSIGGSVQQQQTMDGKDQDAGPMIVNYVHKEGSVDDNSSENWDIKDADGNIIQHPSCRAIGDIQVPQVVIHFSRREKLVPSQAIIENVGNINKAPITWGDFQADPLTLLCSRIEANSNDGGNSYVVEYEFLYNADSWNLHAFYTLPNGTTGVHKDTTPGSLGPGDIPEDADFESFIVYDLVDFNKLALQ